MCRPLSTVGARLDITALLLGTWPPAATITATGHVQNREGEAASTLGDRIAVLDTTDAVAFLTTLREAHTGEHPPTPHPGCRPRRSRSTPNRAPAVPTRHRHRSLRRRPTRPQSSRRSCGCSGHLASRTSPSLVGRCVPKLSNWRSFWPATLTAPPPATSANTSNPTPASAKPTNASTPTPATSDTSSPAPAPPTRRTTSPKSPDATDSTPPPSTSTSGRCATSYAKPPSPPAHAAANSSPPPATSTPHHSPTATTTNGSHPTAKPHADWGTEAHLLLANDLLHTDPQTASDLLDKAITLDPYNEALYTTAMHARHALDDPDGIHTLLRALTKALTDLDTQPHQDTITLATRLGRQSREA